MEGLNLDWQNVLDGNGLGISVVGVLAVFTGLFLISIFITILPNLLKLTDKLFEKLGIQSGGHGHATVPKKKPEKIKASPAKKPAEAEETDQDLIAAIAYVIAAEAELEAMSDYTKLTIRRDDSQQIWGVAGRMRTLATRKIRTNS